jgi:Mycoplasma protein of unknown function, DUF285
VRIVCIRNNSHVDFFLASPGWLAAANIQTGKVTTMREMFSGAEAFGATGSNLTGWDLSNVADTSTMFNMARSFNADISTWDSK